MQSPNPQVTYAHGKWMFNFFPQLYINICWIKTNKKIMWCLSFNISQNKTTQRRIFQKQIIQEKHLVLYCAQQQQNLKWTICKK